jgi:centromeric protein E
MASAPVPPPGGARAGENIWVGVRLRPLNELELYRARDVAVWAAGADGRTLRFDAAAAAPALATVSGRPATPAAAYAFDRVFAPAAGNDTVYKEAASPLVRSAMAGVNGTLFAYGQTGGGKTFTMKAVMEAACAEVFDIIKATPGREYLLRLSAVEIYNEARADALCGARA